MSDESDALSELYQEVILDHSHKPRNFRVMPDANHSAKGHNPLCGDDYTVFLKLEGDIVRDISFQGSGCAISKASASMMTEALKGKTIAEVRTYFGNYQAMVTAGDVNTEEMGKLSAFTGVRKFPMRVKCAILPWHAMLAGLNGEAGATTDDKFTPS